jgi:asparagine synthase (glutamine-hydrolysing)
MCGIYGIIGADRADLELVIPSMDRRLIHRGPDEGGCRSGRLGGFGMRRLSIVDLAGGGQPIGNEAGDVWITFNGEIYDYRSLRNELIARGHRFRTSSDTEVVLRAYEAFGDACVERLRGMFAFAIWDETRGRVLLARDPIGKKPLYWWQDGSRIVYASELKALLADPKFERRVNREAIWHYLTFKHVPAPLTAFEGVNALPAGSILVIEGSIVLTRSYWRPRFTGELDVSENDAAERLLSILDDAVRLRVHSSDVPVGAFLSGGVDSSLVVALAASHAPKPLRTYAMGYAQRIGHKNDLEFARSVSAEFGTEHHEVMLESSDVVEALPAIVASFDEPFGGTISPWLISKRIARDVKVALSGDGADELFGSYAAHRMAAVIAGLRKGGTDYGSFAAKSALADQSAREEDGLWRTRFAAFTDAEKQHLMRDPDPSWIPSSQLVNKSFAVASKNDLVNATLQVECELFLPDGVLTYVDRLSMAHSLEVRVPFLDREVVEFAGQLPGRLKVRTDETKAVLKRAASRLLPAEIINRPKEGFVLPMDAWLAGELAPVMREILSPSALDHGLFDASTVNRYWSDHRSGLADHTYRLWTLAAFQLWYGSYFRDDAFSATSPALEESA